MTRKETRDKRWEMLFSQVTKHKDRFDWGGLCDDIVYDLVLCMKQRAERDALSYLWKRSGCKGVPPWVPRRVRELWRRFDRDDQRAPVAFTNADIEAIAISGEVRFADWAFRRSAQQHQHLWGVNGHVFQTHANDRLVEWFFAQDLPSGLWFRIRNHEFWQTLIHGTRSARETLLQMRPSEDSTEEEKWFIHHCHRMLRIQHHAGEITDTGDCDHAIVSALGPGLKPRAMQWYLESNASGYLNMALSSRNRNMLRLFLKRSDICPSVVLGSLLINWSWAVDVIGIIVFDQHYRDVLALDAFCSNSLRLVRHWMPNKGVDFSECISSMYWPQRISLELFKWCVERDLLYVNLQMFVNLVLFHCIEHTAWLVDSKGKDMVRYYFTQIQTFVPEDMRSLVF
jgi:hypothetical protein